MAEERSVHGICHEIASILLALPPTNIATAGGHLKDQFPLEGTPQSGSI